MLRGDGVYDAVRAGAHLVLGFDSASQSFTGTVTNVTDVTLSRVRVEVHLSNGVELGPTQPRDLAPGQSVPVTLDASGQTFSSWGAHPEVGGGGGNTGETEGSGEHGGTGEGGIETGEGGEGNEGSEHGEGSDSG